MLDRAGAAVRGRAAFLFLINSSRALQRREVELWFSVMMYRRG